LYLDHIIQLVTAVLVAATWFANWRLAKKTDEVQAELAKNTEKTLENKAVIKEVKEQTEAIHEVVNGNKLKILEELASLQHRVAKLTKTPADIQAAKDAREIVRKEQEKQGAP
jgi:hypothetical protein